ncbi:MAG: hypothetical protein IKA95_02185 [Clostridia bacterium]|nr:hypothetical protein [Clostridia bacterium]
MTQKLYDNDSHATEFDAVVLACEKIGDVYKTELDRTLFFPEEGGQCSDRGHIDGVEIIGAELCGDTIYHISHEPLEAGKMVHGSIDFALRFRNMQNHSGEHIICGIAHRLYGYKNVGFHLGEKVVTMDLSGELDQEQIKKVELLANEAVAKNMSVTACYPSADELDSMDFRAKGNIEGAVRVVTIGDVDACACCAPHVKHTGEIGIIKITDAMRHRGGMRLTILCGFDALRDYDQKCEAARTVSNLLSVPQNEIAQGVQALLDEVNHLRAELSQKDKKLSELVAASADDCSGNICLFYPDADGESLRRMANILKAKTPRLALALSGDDERGYTYVMAMQSGEIAPFSKDANSALNGRGGGKGTMASGRFACSREKIEKYFDII